MPPLELGILGAGAAAREHARCLARMRAPVRIAFASRTAERAADAAASVAGTTSVAGYDVLLDGTADAVLVATPPASHRELVMRALAAGKDVVAEKPAFLTLEDFDAVAEAARRAGRLVLVAENYRYKPAVARVRRLLERRAVGSAVLAAVTAVKDQPVEGWRAHDEVAGPPLVEGGVHWIAVMAQLGRVTDVAAWPLGGATGAHLAFGYADGWAGTLDFSWNVWSPLRGPRISRVYGTSGSIAFEPSGAFVASFGRRPSIRLVPPHRLTGHDAMWRAFLPALAAGRDPADSLAAGRRDVELALRALADLRTRAAARSS